MRLVLVLIFLFSGLSFGYASEGNVTFIELGSKQCIPCKMMEPIIEEIKEEYRGRVDVIFYDVWTEQGRPYGEKYNITSIPTQIFLDKNGNEFFRHMGFFPKKEIIKVLNEMGIN
ncbi:thioredoxin family protein [bacterium]|nr:thioredoxin family protein [bacterium]